MDNPNIEAEKGDILWIDNNYNLNNIPHYLVYLEVYPKDTNLFIGAMLTHATMNGNIPLMKDHFMELDKNGNKYQVCFNNSLVINHPLFKKGDCLPFFKVGKLSIKGIEFIEKSIEPYVVQFHQKNIK